MKINSKCIWAIMAMTTCGGQSADATEAPSTNSVDAWRGSRLREALDIRLIAAKWQNALCRNEGSAADLRIAEHDIQSFGSRLVRMRADDIAIGIGKARRETGISASKIAEEAKSRGLSSRLEDAIGVSVEANERKPKADTKSSDSDSSGKDSKLSGTEDAPRDEESYDMGSAIEACIIDAPPLQSGQDDTWEQLIQKVERRARMKNYLRNRLRDLDIDCHGN